MFVGVSPRFVSFPCQYAFLFVAYFLFFSSCLCALGSGEDGEHNAEVGQGWWRSSAPASSIFFLFLLNRFSASSGGQEGFYASERFVSGSCEGSRKKLNENRKPRATLLYADSAGTMNSSKITPGTVCLEVEGMRMSCWF